MNQSENNNLAIMCCGIVTFCLFLALAGLLCLLLFPVDQVKLVTETTTVEKDLAEIPFIDDSADLELYDPALKNVSFSEELQVEDYYYDIFDDSQYNVVANANNRQDVGLELYRSIQSRAAVEWFYTNITNSREVACAILEAADKNDISVSLAFALAYTESSYKATAVNRNTNASIDRGLFQLNNRSFPDLSEKEFFDPAISAKYGMAHFRFCLDTAGNEITALAMYNAGTNRVRNNATPQITLNYVSKIMNYRQSLEDLFDSEVAQFYLEESNIHLAAINSPVAKGALF